MDIMQQIIQIMTSGLVTFGTNLGAAVQSIVQSLFVSVDGTTGAQSLSMFGTLVVIFCGIALAVGLTRRLFTWLISLGGSK